MKKNEKVGKIYTYLISSLVVVAFLTITLSRFIEKDLGHDIQSMIGMESSVGYSISIRDNYILKSAIDIYIQTIHSGDLTGAYEYLLPQYKNHISEEIYIQKMNEIGTENFVIQDLTVTQHTERLFSFDVKIKNDLKLKLLIILDDENYYIVPEPFLDYKTVDKKITKKGVTYHLKGYQVDLERCIFDMIITNNNNKEIEICEVKMTDLYGGNQNALNEQITLAANETKEVSFLVETSIDFPETLEITRKDGKKLRVYTFEF